MNANDAITGIIPGELQVAHTSTHREGGQEIYILCVGCQVKQANGYTCYDRFFHDDRF
jgi:hypothetical protein